MLEIYSNSPMSLFSFKHIALKTALLSTIKQLVMSKCWTMCQEAQCKHSIHSFVNEHWSCELHIWPPAPVKTSCSRNYFVGSRHLTRIWLRKLSQGAWLVLMKSGLAHSTPQVALLKLWSKAKEQTIYLGVFVSLRFVSFYIYLLSRL